MDMFVTILWMLFVLGCLVMAVGTTVRKGSRGSHSSHGGGSGGGWGDGGGSCGGGDGGGGGGC